MTFRTGTCFTILFLLNAAIARGAEADPGSGFTLLGRIKPRHAREIESSNWSIGAETMDRDYTIYRHWRNYLGPLGMKQARIQSGWAKTEREKGRYDWQWLDEIIPDMVSQGVKPWICLCYGNPIYEGGGGTGLAGGLPTSDEALRAWDDYVFAVVERYGQQVDQWEIWNEPRTGRGKGADDYARFADRTARQIHREQPEARILVAAGGAFDVRFVEQTLAWFRDHSRLALVDEIVFHPYAYNPDDSYGRVAELRKIVQSFSEEITIRQNENGVPSERGSFGAVADYDWTELRQAKWATRRLLGDLGRDIPSSYFAICDMAYRVPRGTRADSDFRDDQQQLEVLINRKGLLAINADRTVHHAKLAYRTIQHITALFDNSVRRVEDFRVEVAGGGEDAKFSIFGYRSERGGQLITLWRSSDTPGKRPEMEDLQLTIPGAGFEDPVWIDLVSGQVYDIDDSIWNSNASGSTFQRMPVYDACIVVAERASVADILASDLR